jgi:hypothetical protein
VPHPPRSRRSRASSLPAAAKRRSSERRPTRCRPAPPRVEGSDVGLPTRDVIDANFDECRQVQQARERRNPGLLLVLRSEEADCWI